jgi:hypothetical protein
LYLNAHTSNEASAQAALLAQSTGVTKTDVYRDALIQFDPKVRDLWVVAPASTKGAVKRSAGLIKVPPVETVEISSLATVVRKLEDLKADLPNLPTRRASDRLDTIIRRVKAMEAQTRQMHLDRRNALVESIVRNNQDDLSPTRRTP